MTYIWTYRYDVGTVQHYVNAPNRKDADRQVKKQGVPSSAFVERF